VTRALLLAVAVLLAAAGCGDDSSPGTNAEPVSPLTEGTTTTLAPTTTPAVVTTTTAAAEAPDAPEYVFPLSPTSVARFSNSGHHDYPAVDIFAPIGTGFVAVTDGVVDFVSRVDTWDPESDDPVVRGGLSVAIVGDDGVRYYGSHLSAVEPGIEPGVRVQAGDRLGLSGKSGNAAPTDPHLHFGISHPTTADDWSVRRGEVDPFPYLVAWDSGQDLTPELP
jgi:murein DD-endopeptidase MepM/ murein hydrolase activator NlpD